VASCKVKVGSLSSSVQKNMIKSILFQKVDGVPVFNETKVYSTSIYATYGISDQVDGSITYVQAKVMQQIRF
jgi:hypothetical protein